MIKPFTTEALKPKNQSINQNHVINIYYTIRCLYMYPIILRHVKPNRPVATFSSTSQKNLSFLNLPYLAMNDWSPSFSDTWLNLRSFLSLQRAIRAGETGGGGVTGRTGPSQARQM